MLDAHCKLTFVSFSLLKMIFANSKCQSFVDADLDVFKPVFSFSFTGCFNPG